MFIIPISNFRSQISPFQIPNRSWDVKFIGGQIEVLSFASSDHIEHPNIAKNKPIIFNNRVHVVQAHRSHVFF